MSRWIAHIDMDCFFVAVERRLDSTLTGKPVVVGGSGPRAVVASASYEARKFGVRSAMPMSQARRRCPRLIIVPPHFSEYSRISKLVFAKLEELAPVIEQVSIDEAYLDFSGCEKLFSSREQSAETVRRTVLKVSQLTCSVGIATNKLLAKIASDQCKPDGFRVIPEGTEEKFLAPLSVRTIPGIGTKTAAQLQTLNILTCQDLARASEERLSRFGAFGKNMKALARGIDLRSVQSNRERKSYGSERTFESDVSDTETLRGLLRKFAEEIGLNLRNKGLKARTVQIKIRYPDFTTVTRACTLEQPTHIAADFDRVAQDMLIRHKDPAKPLRLIGLSVRNLVDEQAQGPQLDLFDQIDPNRVKASRIEQLKNELQRKFGEAGFIRSFSSSRDKNRQGL